MANFKYLKVFKSLNESHLIAFTDHNAFKLKVVFRIANLEEFF